MKKMLKGMAFAAMIALSLFATTSDAFAKDAKQALRELRANSGTQFNPVVVEAFIKTVVGERRKSARGAESPHQQVYQQAVEAVRVSL